jgi:Ca2+-transporting ATPase
VALTVVVVLQIAVVHAPVLHGLFDTAPLTSDQWLTAVVIGSLVLWVEEAHKLVTRVHRARRRRHPL